MVPSTQLLVAAAWLAGLADGTADVAGDFLSGGKASLKQVRREKYKFNGVVSTYMTYLKHGVPVPQYLHDAVARTGLWKQSTSSVIATPIDPIGSEYTVPVSIGTPPQVLRLEFDTGSADTWGYSTLMPNSQVNGQTRYDPSQSSTSKRQQGSTWKIRYGDGASVSGVVFNDLFDVAGITAENQAFEAAMNLSGWFADYANLDGIFGLAFDHLNEVRPHKVKTFMDHAKAKLDAPLFTADLKYNSPGTFNFGYIDPSSHEGNITYVPVYNDEGYWNFSSSGFAVGNGPFQPVPIFGIADTGTTGLYLTQKAVHAYYAQVDGAFNSSDYYGAYVFPCNNTLPSFTFGVDEARFTIPGTHLHGSPVEHGNSSAPCYGGLQWIDDDFSVFGELALKAALVVFKYPADVDDVPMLGWANKKLD